MPMADILHRPLSILPVKSVCHFTRPTSITPSLSKACRSMKVSMPSGVRPVDTTSSELTTGQPIADSTTP